MKIRLATSADNQSLLILARSTPMESQLTVNVDRAPDYFCLANLQGRDAKVFVAEQDGVISGAIGCSLRDVLLFGQPECIAYIGGIKVAAAARKGLTGFRLMKAVADYLRATPIRMAIVITMENNTAMAPILAGRVGMPPFHILNQFEVNYIRPVFRPMVSKRYHIRPYRANDLESLAKLFAAFYRDYALSAEWTPARIAAMLTGQPDFNSENILVAEKDGRLVAALTWWDQTGFKKTIVEQYGGRLKILVKLLKPFKILPAEGEPFSELNIRHVVYGENSEKAARDLIRYLISEKRRQYRLFRIGFQKKSPLGELLIGLPRLKVNLNCYIAFKDKDDESRQIISALRQSLIWEDLSLH